MSFKPSIPRSLLLDGEHSVESHFDVVNYQVQCKLLMSVVATMYDICLMTFYAFLQMKQIRTALAIASLLNRTLVRTRLTVRKCISFVIVAVDVHLYSK